MNEEGDVVMEIWRNKFIGENSKQTEAWARERSKFVTQFGDLKRGEDRGGGGADGRSFPRHNMRPCTVRAPKLVWAKNIQYRGFLLFVSYDLMSCEVFT